MMLLNRTKKQNNATCHAKFIASAQKVGTACENRLAAEQEASGRTLLPSNSYVSQGAEAFQTWPRSSPGADALCSCTCGGRCPPWPTVWRTDPHSSRSGSASWTREVVQAFPLSGFQPKRLHPEWFTYIKLIQATMVVVFHLGGLFISGVPNTDTRQLMITQKTKVGLPILMAA